MNISVFFVIVLTVFSILHCLAVVAKINLRSGTDTVQFPVELQVANDSEFIQKLLQTQSSISDDESSGESDLNCSDLVQGSDTEASAHK